MPVARPSLKSVVDSCAFHLTGRPSTPIRKMPPVRSRPGLPARALHPGPAKRSAPMRYARLLPPCLLLALLLPTLGPGRDDPAVPVLKEAVPLPGGLADPSGQTGFFANARGGIDAVD